MQFVDLSHVIEEDISVFPSLPRPRIEAYFTHSESLPHYEGRACFEVTHVDMVTSLGTYLDSPYHRYPHGAAIDQLSLSQCVVPGTVVDVRNKRPEEPILADDVAHVAGCGKAVLLCTGWDRHWKQPAYHRHPFVSAEAAELLVSRRPSLVGIDVLNVDTSSDAARPAHTQLLGNGILIVENLRGLEQLVGRSFVFVCAPVKVRGAAAFPVRAFALLDTI